MNHLPIYQSVSSQKYKAIHPIKLLITCFPALFLVGCVPIMHKTAPMEASAIKNDLGKYQTSYDETATHIVHNWWKYFNDPQLDLIINEALSTAPSLQTLESRYAQANSIIASVESLNLPHISADAGLLRERFSENHIFPPPLGGSTNNQYSSGFTLKYDFDFWNERSSRIQAVKYNAYAQRAFIEAAKIALSSAMCEAYLSWYYDEQKLEILQALEHTNTQELNILEKQYHLGLIDVVALNNAKGSIAAISQRIEETKRSIEGKKEVLCVLGGFLPSRADRMKSPHINRTFSLPIPKKVMLNLLSHRADISVAKYTVLSKSSTIEETKAQFYPNISLNGIIGFTSFSWSKFIDHSSFTPSSGVAFSLPIFDWGMRKANLQNSTSDYNASVYEYNDLILKAANEVVLLLKHNTLLDKEQTFNIVEINAKKANQNIARKKLMRGFCNKLPYISAQKIVQEAQIRSLSLSESKTQLQISLIKALGGGYTEKEDTNASR